jgi:hypothetical protein
MNRKNYFHLTLGCLLLLSILLQPFVTMAQTTVKASVDSRRIAIGEQLHLFLEVSHREQDGKLVWPAVPQFSGLEIVDTGKVDSLSGANGQVLYKQKLTLTGFDSGTYIIPPVAFTVQGPDGQEKVLTTDSTSITIQTVQVDLQKPIRPIKDIIQVPKAWWEYWPWAVGALLAAAVLFFLWRWLRKRSRTPRKLRGPVEQPHEKALRMLEEMSHKPYEEQGLIKEYYTDLTNILRTYLEERYGIAAAELTTDDLLKLAKQNRELKKIRQELKQIFIMADLAKFAKAAPEHQEQVACMDAATKIIYKTKSREPEEGAVV